MFRDYRKQKHLKGVFLVEQDLSKSETGGTFKVKIQSDLYGNIERINGSGLFVTESEEFYEISKEEDFDILDESIRGQLPEGYFKRITATFNPWSERHFSKRKFFDSQSSDVLAMTTTYLDNPYLSKTDLNLFERMKEQNPRRYRVAGLGEFGIAEGLIYENWQEKEFSVDEIKKIKGIQSAFGLDFGLIISSLIQKCILNNVVNA